VVRELLPNLRTVESHRHLWVRNVCTNLALGAGDVCGDVVVSGLVVAEVVADRTMVRLGPRLRAPLDVGLWCRAVLRACEVEVHCQLEDLSDAGFRVDDDIRFNRFVARLGCFFRYRSNCGDVVGMGALRAVGLRLVRPVLAAVALGRG
jgi:hypothetical protein